MTEGYQARAEAASRLPPLASGTRDPDLVPADGRCYICGHRKTADLARIFGKLMCRDRVACYQRTREGHT
jgi:hypothetical protein